MTPPRIRWVVFIAAVTFLTAVLLTSFFKELERIDNLSKALDERMEELVKEERKAQELQQNVDYYSTPKNITRLARKQFNLIISGEKIYKIEVVSKEPLQ